MSENKQDSKTARMYLRMVLKEQGQPVQEELNLNSWELVDLIIKNIHLVDNELRNLRRETRKDREATEVLRQMAMFAASQLLLEEIRGQNNE